MVVTQGEFTQRNLYRNKGGGQNSDHIPWTTSMDYAADV